MSAALVILLILVALGSRSPSSFTQSSPTQIQSTAQILDDDGPTADGSTVVRVVNSIPHPMVFRANSQETLLPSCPTCKIYRNKSEIPADIYDRGTKATIVMKPGINMVHWYHPGGDIAEIRAEWNLKPGRKYLVCMSMDLSEGRSNWDTAK